MWDKLRRDLPIDLSKATKGIAGSEACDTERLLGLEPDAEKDDVRGVCRLSTPVDMRTKPSIR